MKKEWISPELEMLDVTMTMAGTNYTSFDGNFSQNDGIPTDHNGNPLIGNS